MRKVIVVLSGGMDSTVLLHWHLRVGDEVRAIGINYGQRHVRELEFAAATCQRLGVPFVVADLRALGALLPGSSQTDKAVALPEGHYTAESMKATVVPNRNMILLAVALGQAVAYKFDGVSYAAHAGDHAIYPDCREEFVAALNQAAVLCDWHPVEIFRPFVFKSKKDIAEIGEELGVDPTTTYSCYAGGTTHCGKCGTCVERRESLYLAGVVDNTGYLDTRRIQDIIQLEK